MSKPNPNFRWSVIKDNFLSEKECDDMIKYIDENGVDTRVEGNEFWDFHGESYDTTKCIIPNKEIEERAWVTTKLANTLHWKFKLDGVRYIKGLYYNVDKFDSGPILHSDFDTTDTTHKVSGIIFLNDDYEGGGLTIFRDTVPSKKGRIVLFPAFAAHQVQEFTKSDRYTIIVVVEGDCFV